MNLELVPDPLDDDTDDTSLAEAALIAAALQGADTADLGIKPDDFDSNARRNVWRAVEDLTAKGMTPGWHEVGLWLTEHKVKVPDLATVHEWGTAPAILSSIDYYAEKVLTASGSRRLVEAAVKVAGIARESGVLAERREKARQAIDEACAGQNQTKARTLADIITNVYDVAQHGQAAALSTPWPDLDRLIDGIAPGRLIVFAARPGVGKSVALANLALHTATRHGHAAHFASLEMPALEVGQRLTASHLSVSLSGLMKGRTDEHEWKRMEAGFMAWRDYPLSIDDAPGQTVAHIRKTVRDLQRTRDDVALVCVDYLQLVRAVDPRVNRAEQVAQISRDLKLLARESGACVVAAAQLNREAAKRDKPQLTDLRESGAIEADADQVVLMHQPNEEIPEIELVIDKNRHGPKGNAYLQLAGAYSQLRSVGRL